MRPRHAAATGIFGDHLAIRCPMSLLLCHVLCAMLQLPDLVRRRNHHVTLNGGFVGFYEQLGLRRVLNGAASFTLVGGSLMPDEVLDAMHSAAQSYVDMHELHAPPASGWRN